MDHPKQVFTIQQLSRKLSIPKPTLRFWEKELDGIIVPHRTEGGQRRYTSEHIAILERIRNMKNQGKSLSEIKIELGTPQKPNVDTLQPNHMDLIPTRVAEVVREELTRFFQNIEVVKIKQD